MRDQSAMRLYLLQRLCQIAVKNKKSGASSDCKLLRRNVFFGVFHGRNTAGPAIAPGVEREERADVRAARAASAAAGDDQANGAAGANAGRVWKMPRIADFNRLRTTAIRPAPGSP
jgi:hypothetical protein